MRRAQAGNRVTAVLAAEPGLSARLASDAGPAVPLSPAQSVLAEEVRRRLGSGALATESTACICGTHATDHVIGLVDRLGLQLRSVVCDGCGTVRADPYLDEAGLREFYRDYYQDLYARASDPVAYFETQKQYGRRVLGALRSISPGARRAMEVGCGAGGALSVLRDAGLLTGGCDHSRRLIEFGAARGLPRLAVGDLHDLGTAVPDLGSEDLIYLHHVFEHMSDPGRFLLDCAPLLAQSGAVLAIVPDISRIHAFPFPGGDVRLFLHIAHKFNYSREGLQRLGARCGYSVEFLDGFESRVAPEMWALFRPRRDAGALPADGNGRRMLSYLRKTESRYRFGLLPGYGVGYRGRVKRLLKRVLPRPLLAWLRR
jgi:SAM-dependent methyltransferase